MYVAPSVEVLGGVAELTLGQFFSRCDGHSGTVGNMGAGGGGCEGKTG